MSRIPSRAARAIGVLSVATALVLTGCSSGTPSDAPSSMAKGEHASLSLQLRFTPTVQFAGSYVADAEGYYADEDLDVKIVAGGPSVDVGTVLAQGTADVGISSIKQVTQANAQGADLVIVAAGYQHSASMYISMPDKPIKTPQAMVGKTIGSVATNVTNVETFLTSNGLNKTDAKIVPVQGDVAPLISGQVDAIYTVYPTGYEQMKRQGIDPVMMMLKDFHHDNLDYVYAVSARTLKDTAKRDAIVRFLQAEAKGWTKANQDPALAADLAVNKYGKELGLDLAGQTEQAKDQATMFDVDAGSPGIFWMPKSGIDASIATMKHYGLTLDPAVFDTSLIKEVYKRG